MKRTLKQKINDRKQLIKAIKRSNQSWNDRNNFYFDKILDIMIINACNKVKEKNGQLR